MFSEKTGIDIGAGIPFFGNFAVDKALMIIIIITVIVFTITATVGILQHWYIEKYASEKRRVSKKLFQFGFIICLSLSGFCLASLISTGAIISTAVSHGMSRNQDTGEYAVTLSEAKFLNQYSTEEYKGDVTDLRNQSVIFVRYDCPDCVILHDTLQSVHDENVIIFLDSRTIKGKAVRDVYQINLTEVPQGVYIDDEGKPLIINILAGQGETMTIDMSQVERLYTLMGISRSE